MMKDHSDSERGNPLPPLHELIFLINSKWSFICTIPQTGYHIPRSLLIHLVSTGWNEKYFNGSTMRDRSDDPSHHERMLYQRSYISLFAIDYGVTTSNSTQFCPSELLWPRYTKRPSTICVRSHTKRVLSSHTHVYIVSIKPYHGAPGNDLYVGVYRRRPVSTTTVSTASVLWVWTVGVPASEISQNQVED